MAEGKTSILVLGLGNTLLSDEAVGVRVAEALAEDAGSGRLGLTCRDGGTMGLSLLVEMEDAGALVIVDAAELNAAPGTVRVFEGVEMDDFLRTRGITPHDIGLEDLMDALRLRGALPGRRALIGIQPETLAVGETLSPPVAAAVSVAAQAVKAVAHRWRAAE